MKFHRLLSILSIALLIVAAFLPWMTIESKGITVTGMNTTGTNFGKPALFHFILGGLYLLFVLISKVWAQRIAVVFAAFNIAWAVRNFLLIAACAGGECPVRKTGLYLVLLSAAVMFVAPLLQKSGPSQGANDSDV